MRDIEKGKFLCEEWSGWVECKFGDVLRDMCLGGDRGERRFCGIDIDLGGFKSGRYRVMVVRWIEEN